MERKWVWVQVSKAHGWAPKAIEGEARSGLVSVNAQTDRFKRGCEKAGIPGVTPRGGRVGASNERQLWGAAQNSINGTNTVPAECIDGVRRMLGHTHAKTTNKYDSQVLGRGGVVAEEVRRLGGLPGVEVLCNEDLAKLAVRNVAGGVSDPTYIEAVAEGRKKPLAADKVAILEVRTVFSCEHPGYVFQNSICIQTWEGPYPKLVWGSA